MVRSWEQNLLIDTELLTNFIALEEVELYREKVSQIHRQMHKKIGLGSEFLGWLDFPLRDHEELLMKLEETASEIRANATLLVVIGVGGSFLGAKAINDALDPYFGQKDQMEILFAGQNMSGAYLHDLLRYLDENEVYINVISKSGTTTEPAISFRILRNYMEKRYGDEASRRIIVTTDKKTGTLKELAFEKGYRTFIIEDDIGGRYSVLTPVGLLPLAAAGKDIRGLLDGARIAALELDDNNIETNTAYRYAVIRQLLHSKGYDIELLASFEPSLKYFHEWWKQLFGESEGKERQGIFPAAVSYSTDLHSIGQYIQDGKRFLFETLLHFHEIGNDQAIPYEEDDRDNLNYLTKMTLNEINALSKEGTALAHAEGGVPVIKIELAKLDEYHLGYLVYFFMKSCAMSAYLSEVNPFNQPGVEAYKNKMFYLLEKPGFN